MNKRSSRTALTAAAIFGAGLILAGGLVAKPARSGGPDRTFGENGVASVTLPGQDYYFGTGLARTPRGKIVQSVMTAESESGSVVRYTNRGRRDHKFGKRGIASLRFESGAVDPRDILVGKRGRIFVAGEGKLDGSDHYGGALASLLPGGRPNQGFAGDGLFIPETLEGFTPLEMAFAPGGRIVVVGHFGGMPSANTAVVRYRANGRLDRSFSGDGLVRYGVAANQLTRSVAVDRRGRIVVGSPGGAKYRHIHDIARLLPDGRFDRSFGSNGRRQVNAVPTRGTFEEITDVAVDRQGRILVAGGSNSSAGTVVRLRPRGGIDRSFGTRGVTEMAWFTPKSIAFDRAGRVIVIGSDMFGQIWRLGRNGKQDRSFGGYLSRTELLTDGFVDRKGRVVAGGNRTNKVLVVARLRP